MASETQARAFELITSRQERAAAKEERVFECKTCRRLFPSFQALGGHRASHKKPRVANAGGEPTHGCMLKTHGCSVCGLEFTVGQALGGHMRRHRGKKNAAVEDAKKPLWIDLNRPPAAEDSGEEVERRQFGLTLTLALHQFVDTGTILVDC